MPRSNQLSYIKLLGSGGWSSPLRNDVLVHEMSHCVSPESSSYTNANRSIRLDMKSSHGSIQQGADGFDPMTMTDVLPKDSSSSTVFGRNSFDDHHFAVDHISEWFTQSFSSATQSAAVSPFRDDSSAKITKTGTHVDEVESPSFKLSSVMTSPANRMRIDSRFHMKIRYRDKIETIPDETPRISNGAHQITQDDVPNFSIIASPVAKQEDHTVNVDLSDWSLDMNFKSIRMESNDSKKSINTPRNFEPDSEWVSFDPFDDLRTPCNIKHSFAPCIPDKIQDNSSWNQGCKNCIASINLALQIGELNARMASVESILRKLERTSEFCGQNIYDDRSIAFFDDGTDRMSDEKTCTPKKMHRNSCIESKSALFSRFFGSKKCQLCEV